MKIFTNKKIVGLLVCSLLLSFTGSVGAMTLSPASGTYGSSSIININIVAAPQAGETAVSLRIQASGLTITGYTPPSGWTTTIPDCSGTAYYTSTNVCASLAKPSITSGESLGTISVRLGTSGSGTLAGISGNVYSNGSTTREITGTLATFSVDQSLPTTLPSTSRTNNTTRLFGILIGASLLTLGVLLMKTQMKAYFAMRRNNIHLVEVEF